MRDARENARLFRLMMHIGRGSNQQMPANIVGAYVPVFVGAPDPEAAAVRVLDHLTGRGFQVIGIGGGEVDELEPAQWGSFVNTAWPELADKFPTQQQVNAQLATGFVFVGPFAGYEAGADQAPKQSGSA